jgi:hypothetical protein
VDRLRIIIGLQGGQMFGRQPGARISSRLNS